jgi:hypothetical protein
MARPSLNRLDEFTLPDSDTMQDAKLHDIFVSRMTKNEISKSASRKAFQELIPKNDNYCEVTNAIRTRVSCLSRDRIGYQ